MSGESAFEDDDDDLEFQELLRGDSSKVATNLNKPVDFSRSEGRFPSDQPVSRPVSKSGGSSNYLPQRTLDGLISTQQPQLILEEIPLHKPVDPPTHHNINATNLATYIYPTNLELRDYQYNIVANAFYNNLLAALPTGLGKTFIASVVMLNYLRWFPDSKIIFMAPTRPLVAQQIKACCSITGIPTSKVAILLDKTRKNRADIWDSKQVFFTTPQVVENDLAAGIVDPKSIILLVVDEAHRARGNYSYNNVVKFLKRFTNSFRVLALTATPASDVEGVQEVVDNLSISKIEVRTENSIDIIKYMKRKKVVRRVIPQSAETSELIEYLCHAIEPTLIMANEKNIYEITDPSRINFFHCMETSRRLMLNKSIPEGLKWSNYFVLQLLGVVGQCLRRLNIYGIKSFYSYFKEKHLEFTTKWKKKKSTNKTNADFYFADSVNLLLERAEAMMANPVGYSHPKIEAIMEELEEFFSEKDLSSSKVIIFTEFRESALEIVQSIEKFGKGFKPHIFIGQSKEKDKFSEESLTKKGKKQLKESKQKDASERSANRTSSEDAQVKGMNQKLQKEIIRKFKKGDYNILVATSIGEEGLDIGEVDLIICYDSTSSPIKNVQRMGRTGRRREGKVVLLFSSNEETKFDKAMAGYEYIQQHIMQSNMIQLSPRNRIIPPQYQPKVDKQFIEIPEENIELKKEEDEDEIIRIATQHMLGTQKPKAKAKSKTKTSKIAKSKPQKKFFMPDDVNAGFRSVTSMMRVVGEKDSLEESKRKPDVLDKILDSDEEVIEERPVREYKGNNQISEDINNIQAMEDPDINRVEEILDYDSVEEVIDNHEEEEEVNKSLDANSSKRAASLSDEEDLVRPTKKKSTLGTRRRALVIEPDDDDIDSFLEAENAAHQVQEEHPEDPQVEEQVLEVSALKVSSSEEEDLFDDGLDDELAMISADNISSSASQGAPAVARMYSPEEGLLSEAEKLQLYTGYYTSIDSSQSANYYDPIEGVKADGVSFGGKIGHSSRTDTLVNFRKFVQSVTKEQALSIQTFNQTFKEPSEQECLRYLNSMVVNDR